MFNAAAASSLFNQIATKVRSHHELHATIPWRRGLIMDVWRCALPAHGWLMLRRCAQLSTRSVSLALCNTALRHTAGQGASIWPYRDRA